MAGATMGLVAALLAAGATVPPAPQRLFACSLGGKSVSVTAAGGRLTYRFGTPARAEIVIVGTAAARNVFRRTDRYAGPEDQLRFTNGPYSYVVYSMAGNGGTGARAVSGLVVMKGAARIADLPCTRYAEFGPGIEDLRLPEDTEAYSAM